MMQERPFYSTFSWAYDLIIDAPVGPRCDFLERTVAKSAIEFPLRILDAGCGTGSYAIELGRRGHRVTGVDSSPDQIEQAVAKSESARVAVDFVLDDLLRLKLNQKFDLILCRGVLNDLLLDTERKDLFQSFAGVIEPGGVLLFDVRDWEGSVRQKTANPITTKELETDRGYLKFTSNTKLNENNRMLVIHEKHILTGPRGVEEYDWDFSMRCWTADEIKTQLDQARFAIVEQFGDFDEDIPLGSTERIVTMAIKINR